MLQILSTLRRHRTATLLIVLEIALTCAIVCNAIFLIRERLARMDQPSGVAESELVRARLTGIGAQDNAAVITQQDLAALRTIPGVKAATAINMVPFGGSSWNTGVSITRDDPSTEVNVGLYMGRELIPTLGLALIAGRDFTPEEYIDVDDDKAWPRQVIVTKALAEHFYPNQSPLGKPLYASGKEPQTIVGVIDHIARPNSAYGDALHAVLLPVTVSYTSGGNYVLRVDSSRKDAVLAAVDQTLAKVDPNRLVLTHETFEQTRRDHFKQDRSMAYLLAGVAIALLVITALGVVGLASFWVQRRTRQIGVRRALGATKRDILRYFQLENFILATAGIVIGMGLAFGINQWLMHAYEVKRLPSSFLPIGAVLLWLLGQIAVLGPALRASTIPPAIATRTV
ncbi:MAG TPA: FtsX-like permease family protein [Kofleriaceae bacterium]|jgi:putative ABC transport system permease protein|nr:FtsX-like permease family protein [Kofleriaceae bacterium]